MKIETGNERLSGFGCNGPGRNRCNTNQILECSRLISQVGPFIPRFSVENMLKLGDIVTGDCLVYSSFLGIKLPRPVCPRLYPCANEKIDDMHIKAKVTPLHQCVVKYENFGFTNKKCKKVCLTHF